MIYNLPRAKKKGETWVINMAPNLNNLAVFTVNFVSNGEQYEKIRIAISFVSKAVCIYYESDTTSKVVFDNGAWLIDDAYRTIALASPATGDLLTWLQSNAVKQ